MWVFIHDNWYDLLEDKMLEKVYQPNEVLNQETCKISFFQKIIRKNKQEKK